MIKTLYVTANVTGASPLGRQNNRQGWRGLPQTETQTYLMTSSLLTKIFELDVFFFFVPNNANKSGAFVHARLFSLK
jgi:hypothetical protein